MKISDILQFPARPRTLPAPAGFGAYAALLSRAFVPCLFFDIMMYADRSVVHFSTLHLCLYLLWFGVLPQAACFCAASAGKPGRVPWGLR